MADLPGAKTRIGSQTGTGAPASDLDVLVVLCAVALHADITPRVFTSPDALLEQHDYCEGAEYFALHAQETKKAIIFVGLPIVTPGVIGRKNSAGNTGTSVVTLTEGPSGTLGETDGQLSIVRGGVVGTDQIMLGLSQDGGRTVKPVRLGTANSYTIPRIGASIGFGAGSLVTGDVVMTWHTSAPRWDQAGLQAARLALAGQQKGARSWLVIGDLLTEDDASDVVTEVNAYETENDRFVYVRAQVRDRLPQAAMSREQVRMTGNPNLTFAEVGGTGDTITRSAGSWITDGFAVGDTITVTLSASNNVTGPIASLSATVITLGTTDLAAEGPVANVTVVGTPTLTFAEVGATGDTLTRSRGSWLADGFRIGDLVTIAGSASNNLTASAGLVNVTATVLTFGTTDLAAEVIGSFAVTLTAGETKTQHVSTMDAEFGDIDAERRIDLGFGRGRKLSPILGYRFRRPVQWAASIREYQHDVHIPVWAKEQGPLKEWDLFDAQDNLVEHDERVDGGALAARFTCFRTWSNGPSGAFIALSLTREVEGSMLSRTHNMAVADVGCSIVQRETENAVGRVLELQEGGTATPVSLSKLEEGVNSQLDINLLANVKGEGKRASLAVWRANPATVLNVPDAKLTGKLRLLLDGTLEDLDTTVDVQTAG